MIVVKTGINDNTIWDIVKSICISDSSNCNLKTVVINNVLDTLLLGTINDIATDEVKDIEDDLADKKVEERFLSELYNIIKTSNPLITDVKFNDKELIEPYRDVSVAFDINYSTLKQRVKNLIAA